MSKGIAISIVDDLAVFRREMERMGPEAARDAKRMMKAIQRQLRKEAMR